MSLLRLPPLSARALVRLALIAVVAAAMMWVVVASTVATIQRTRNPDGALAWWADAETQTVAAYKMIQDDQRPETLQRARSLAEASLLREPVSAAAARTLGIIADLERRPEDAARYFTYSERLSRRDVPTQLWFIETRVRANDVEGALRHYDRALRVSRDIRNVLFPILAQAASDPGVIDPLARLVASRPPWWSSFADYLVGESESPQGIARILSALRLDPAVSDERALLARAIARLTDMGGYSAAAALYTQARNGTGGAIRNGDFRSADMDFPPFDWLLVDQSDLGAVREPSQAGDDAYVLTLRASSGSMGEVARQLMLLPPNRYLMQVRFGGSTPSSRPTVTVTCAGEQGASLAQLELPGEGSVATSQAVFAVPQGCNAQWLRIIARADGESSDTRIESVAVSAL